jgi:hypothetical protein
MLKLMKKLLLILCLLTTVIHGTVSKASAAGAPLPAGGNQSTSAPQTEGLQEQMLQDEGVMALIGALQEDPEMQALLNDPAVQRAVQSGDINALLNNPAFMKLLTNPRVKEIERKLNPSGSGGQ